MKPNLIVEKLSIYNKKVKENWEKWENDASVSPFLYYKYSKFIYNFYRFWAIKYTARIMCVSDKDGKMLMIMPLKKRIFNKYNLLCDIQGSGAAGCICDPALDEATKDACLDAIFSKTGNLLNINRVKPNNPLYSYLTKRADKYTEKATTVCVTIPVPEKFEDLFATLSSSNRQNIRTAYNRLNRDGKSYELKTFDGADKLGKKERNEIMALYLKRLFTKYKKPKPIETTIRKFKYNHIKHDTLSLFSLDNAFHAILYIDGKAAGFFSGITDRGHSTVVVPRLAIDIDYKFYSPGYILLCETLKRLAAGGAIKELDLSRGDEKYKLDIGGVKYYTHSFECK